MLWRRLPVRVEGDFDPLPLLAEPRRWTTMGDDVGTAPGPLSTRVDVGGGASADDSGATAASVAFPPSAAASGACMRAWDWSMSASRRS